MVDLVDLATERSIADEALTAHKNKLKRQADIPRGVCLYCDAPLDAAQALYCDAACREDHEHEQHIRAKTTLR